MDTLFLCKNPKHLTCTKMVAFIGIWLNWHNRGNYPCMPRSRLCSCGLKSVSLCVWHLPEHYAQDVPSPKLIEQWNRIIQHRWMQDSDVPNSLARVSIQSLIPNGIFFPIWKMTACEFIDSRGLQLQLRNNNMALFWHPSPEEFEKRDQSGIHEFTLLVCGLSLSCDR